MKSLRAALVAYGRAAAIALAWSASASIAAAQEQGARAVTYNGQIAPILNEHCVSCHRPDAVAPFSLSTYAEVRARARMVAIVTQRRVMPPWKPAPGVARFLGERRLRGDQIDLIQRWVAAGAPEGDPDRAPEPPSWPGGWMRDTPDLVVTMDAPYPLPAAGEDVYRNFVVRVPSTRARFVKAIELKPATTRGVHHARILVDRSGSARRLDAADPLSGYDDRRVDQARSPDGHFLGWAPGTAPNEVPDHLAWRLEPRTDLVLKTHLVPRGEPTPVQVSVGFFFTDTVPTATPAVVQLGSQTIDIPAGASAHVVEDRYRLPAPVDLLAVYPHAHFLARQVEAYAVLPTGVRRPLIRIDDWDFAWQDEYRYAEPTRLPAGTEVVMRFVFDNSAGNPSNPSRPPRRVRFGPQSTDEMAELMLQVLPVDPADRPALVQDVSRHVAQIVLAGSKLALAAAPGSAALQERVGNDLFAVGQVGEAIRHLVAAVRIAPDRASAHYRLGTALAMIGSTADAMESYRRALDLQPDFVEAHNNLGGLLHLSGDLEGAARHYRRTLTLDPAHANAHFNLGNILLGAGRFAEAEVEFRGTLAVRPDYAEAHIGLGRALAARGRSAAAAESYRAALRLNPDLLEARRLLDDVVARRR
ncbi:MAG: tetratricopeptide repeat protein [Acidobacteria bacterium]|nr:tetratricopeptide repeat protein [Acidobacteriota bacterium]